MSEIPNQAISQANFVSSEKANANEANESRPHGNGNGVYANKMNGTKRMKHDKKSQILYFNPKVELLFTVFLLSETLGVIYYFQARNDFQAIFELGVCVMVTASGVYLTKGGFKFFARKFGSKKNMNEVNVRKFADQGWQLIIHLIFTAMEIRILQGVTWWQNPASCWEATGQNYELSPLLKRLYVFQLGARFWSSFSHRFLEEHHKDYFIMFGHHLVTIALTAGTYGINLYGIGVLILIVHNASDIIVDLLKMSNHLGWESKKYFYLTEILFVSNLISWAISRLWIFPVYFVYSALFENEEACRRNGALVACYCMRVMLLALICMHFWWFYLFLKMGYRLVTTGNAHAAARAEYEGESDDEGSPKTD